MSTLILCACQQEKAENTLLSQMQALEAQEASGLFALATKAAEQDDVETARSLIQQALARGAGSTGLKKAETAIQNAEARIAERIAKQKRLEASRRELALRKRQSQPSATSSGSSPYSRPSGLKRIDSVTTGTMSLDTYNAYCLDGTYASVTVSYTWSKSDPIICASNSYKSSKCRNSSDWSIKSAGQYGCER